MFYAYSLYFPFLLHFVFHSGFHICPNGLLKKGGVAKKKLYHNLKWKKTTATHTLLTCTFNPILEKSRVDDDDVWQQWLRYTPIQSSVTLSPAIICVIFFRQLKKRKKRVNFIVDGWFLVVNLEIFKHSYHVNQSYTMKFDC